ncbi:MAG: helix-turn-helix transcriptional regulator [Bacillota bacterium]
MCNHEVSRQGTCPCSGGARMERFVVPCLLLLLYRKPAHGYELLESLTEFGFGEGADPGLVYRNLRRLEEKGHVSSEWETGGGGPARRRYRVTQSGEALIHHWAETIKTNMNRLAVFLQRYQDSFPGRES